MKEKKKVNSYVKVVLWMAFGGAVGAGMSMGSFIAEDGMRAMMEGVSLWMAEHIFIIMCVLAAVCLVTTILCYVKGESIIKKFQEDVDDELVEKLDEKYDFWQTIGVVVSSGMMYVSMTILGFGFRLDSKEAAFNLIYAIVPFLIGTLIAAFYQTAAVKQMRRKDPSSHLFFGTGMTVVVILGMCNIISLIVYFVCAYKIQKAPLDA